MKNFIRLLFTIIPLLITGCSGNDTSSGPSPAAATDAVSMASPALKGSPSPSAPATESQATPIAALSPSLPSGATPSPTKKSDSIIGDALKDQSFQVDLEDYGKSEFITTIEKMNGKDRPHFYLKNGGSVSELKVDPVSPDSNYSVSAVSFRDVSGDGKKDIIVITDYTTGWGYMGAIPISQLLIFKRTESGFVEDRTLEEKAQAGVPYRVLSVQDVWVGLKTDPKDSVPGAWQRLQPGTYMLDGSGELSGSTLIIKKASGDGLSFRLDAFYAPDKEALEQGGVNVGTIDSGIAAPSYSEMIYRDGTYEISFEMISSTVLYVRDNGEPYFGHNVSVNGTYTLK